MHEAVAQLKNLKVSFLAAMDQLQSAQELILGMNDDMEHFRRKVNKLEGKERVNRNQIDQLRFQLQELRDTGILICNICG